MLRCRLPQVESPFCGRARLRASERTDGAGCANDRDRAGKVNLENAGKRVTSNSHAEYASQKPILGGVQLGREVLGCRSYFVTSILTRVSSTFLLPGVKNSSNARRL